MWLHLSMSLLTRSSSKAVLGDEPLLCFLGINYLLDECKMTAWRNGKVAWILMIKVTLDRVLLSLLSGEDFC
jgi:hypothetical protein